MGMSVHGSEPAPQTAGALRSRYEGSLAQELLVRVRGLEASTWIVAFAATTLLAVLPLIILLGALADEQIDDDLSRHLGASGEGSRVVAGLFRRSPTHSAAPIVLGLTVALLGTVGLARSVQALYERAFDQPHQGRDSARFLVWTAALLAALIAEGTYDGPVRAAAGVVARDVLSFALTIVFFAWTMHFLLDGRVPWRRVARPALATALLWLGLALFSSVYFSSAIVSEHRLYGQIGVIFVLTSWFIAIGGVLIVGAASGVLWQDRRERPGRGARDRGA